jgi:hypothetical protein
MTSDWTGLCDEVFHCLYCSPTYLLTYLLTYILTYLLTYLLTPWSRVLLEKLTGLQLVKKFPHFIEPEGSLPHSQVPATCPYPDPARSLFAYSL